MRCVLFSVVHSLRTHIHCFCLSPLFFSLTHAYTFFVTDTEGDPKLNLSLSSLWLNLAGDDEDFRQERARDDCLPQISEHRTGLRSCQQQEEAVSSETERPRLLRRRNPVQEGRSSCRKEQARDSPAQVEVRRWR